MTTPNLGPGDIGDYDEAANNGNLSDLQGANPSDYLSGQLGGMTGPIGLVGSAIMGALGSIVDDVVGYSTDAGQKNLGNARTFALDRIGATTSGMKPRVLYPLAVLLAWLVDGDPEDWDTLEEIRDNLLPALVRRVLGPLGAFISTGSHSEIDSELGDKLNPIRTAATGVSDIINRIVSGLTGTPTTTATLDDLESTMSQTDQRITALEGGGARLYVPSSTTLDLSAHSTWEVAAWGSSLPSAGVTTAGLGANPGTPGGYRHVTFTADDFANFGVPMNAVEILIGTGGGPTKFGRYGAGPNDWMLITGNGGRIGDERGWVDATGSNGGVGGRGGGPATSINSAGDPGIAGASTDLAAGGSAGVPDQGGAGGPGGNGSAADVDRSGPKTGGGGGGGGAGGGRNIFGVGQPGGAGGHGGFPAGAPGGQGHGGANSSGYASHGAAGAVANGVAVLRGMGAPA